MAATAMDGLHMATATTERGPLMPSPRLSPTTLLATPAMAMATTERGLPRPRLSPTTTATPPTAMGATTERGPLMPRPRLSQRLGTMAATAMDGQPMAMATTERGLLMPRPRLSPTMPMATLPTAMATMERGPLMLRPRLSPTTPMALPTVMATTERGLPRPRLSPTTMATPPTATPTTVKIVQPIIDLITTSNHRACFNINLVTITYQKMFCSLQ